MDFYYAIIGWLIYSVYGMVTSLINGEKFNAAKFSTSFIWAILVSIISVFTNAQPTAVIPQYGTSIDAILATVMNSGAGLSLVWFFDRTYKFLTGLGAKLRSVAPVSK
jgi:membrane protein DedA with SNARE-associated domain